MSAEHRTPYVGEGEVGARDSARMDREEADTLESYTERWEQLIDSAERWEKQAHDLAVERIGSPRPSLEQVRESIGSEEMLTALALLALSPSLTAQAASWTKWSDGGGQYEPDGTFTPDALVDWTGWFADIDDSGRGWSTTEWHLLELAAGIVDPERLVSIRGVLGNLGSWETEALRILVGWASGGNNRDLPGRLTVVQGNG